MSKNNSRFGSKIKGFSLVIAHGTISFNVAGCFEKTIIEINTRKI
jgi:hypothetical protein